MSPNRQKSYKFLAGFGPKSQKDRLYSTHVTDRHVTTEPSQDAHDVPQQALGCTINPDFNLMPLWMRLNPLHVMEVPDFLGDVVLRALWTQVLKDQIQVSWWVILCF